MANTGGNPKPLTTTGATATKNTRMSAPGSRFSTSVRAAECCSTTALLSWLSVVEVVSMLSFFLSWVSAWLIGWPDLVALGLRCLPQSGANSGHEPWKAPRGVQPGRRSPQRGQPLRYLDG